MENQKTCLYYRSQTASCDHAIQVPDASYEIGLVANGKGGYQLIWDAYAQGGLTQVVGENGGKLKQAYGIEKAKIEARRKGYAVYEKRLENGNIILNMEGGF
jgi:hypothetical protein